MHAPRSTAARITALASIGAGIVHAVVIADHAQSWWLSGVFFALLTAFQLLWGLLILARPRTITAGGRIAGPMLASFIAVNAGAAILWAVTRWGTGEPFGPQAGAPLPIGPAGIASTALELVVVGVLVISALLSTIRGDAAHRGHPTRARVVAVLLASALVLSAPTAWGVAGGLHHDHSAHAHDDGEDGERASDSGNPGEATSDQSPAPPGRSQPAKGADPQTDGEHADDGHEH